MNRIDQKYHQSIKVGDEVTSLVYGLYRGLKGKVVGVATFHYGVFKRLNILFENGIEATIEQHYLVLWEDWLESEGKI
ncbi:hypothetical protein ACNGFG_08680 [Campylobacter coli]